MSLFDLQQRTDAILKKYEKYDKAMNSKPRPSNGADPFGDELAALEAEVADLNQMAEEIAAEKNRAVVATRNADIRKAKQALLTDGVQGLQKLKKKGKGVTPPIIEEREKQIQQLIEKIFAVPDGLGGHRRALRGMGPPGRSPLGSTGGGGGAGGTILTVGGGGLDGANAAANPYYYKATEETAKFEQEWAHAKARQDAQLDRIERGVGTLHEQARAMGEELDKQTPVLDEVDAQLNKVTGALKSNNAKLSGLLTQMRSRRNFCVDIVLVCILLGIGAYIFTAATKKKA